MNFTNQIAWLAGLIEGEGNVGMYKHNRGDGTYKISASVTIANTDPGIINQIDKIIRKLGVVPYVQEKVFDEKAWNRCYFVRIQNQKDTKTLLDATVGYMFGQKKAISQLTLRFINSRLFAERGTGKKYSQPEEKVYSIVRELNGRGKDKKYPPPETIREKLKNCDIVRTYDESVRGEQK